MAVGTELHLCGEALGDTESGSNIVLVIRVRVTKTTGFDGTLESSRPLVLNEALCIFEDIHHLRIDLGIEILHRIAESIGEDRIDLIRTVVAEGPHRTHGVEVSFVVVLLGIVGDEVVGHCVVVGIVGFGAVLVVVVSGIVEHYGVRQNTIDNIEIVSTISQNIPILTGRDGCFYVFIAINDISGGTTDQMLI